MAKGPTPSFVREDLHRQLDAIADAKPDPATLPG
jgi:hypothetical protein